MTDLEERFTAPEGYTTGRFYNPATRHGIHYAYVTASQPRAVVVVLGGLSEFSEKFYELSRDLLARGYSFFTMDWAYQGRSSRLPAPYSQRRHSDGFEADISDLHKFATKYVRPAAALPGGKYLPVILIAHSMGGMISLRYLSEHTDTFDAAALSAPMLEIPMEKWQTVLLNALHSLHILNKNYVPTMGKDWNDLRRKGDGSEMFSSDSSRDSIHAYWSKLEEVLRVGDPTINWIAQARKSFQIIERSGYLESIKIPVLTAMAGREEIVSNDAIRKASKRLPSGRLLEIEGARHEMLMESDPYRNQFLDAFDKLLKDNNIIPPVQPV